MSNKKLSEKGQDSRFLSTITTQGKHGALLHYTDVEL